MGTLRSCVYWKQTQLPPRKICGTGDLTSTCKHKGTKQALNSGMPAVGEQALLKAHLLMHFISGAQILSNLRCTARVEEPTLTHSSQLKSRLFLDFLHFPWFPILGPHPGIPPFPRCLFFFFFYALGKWEGLAGMSGYRSSRIWYFRVVPLVRTAGKIMAWRVISLHKQESGLEWALCSILALQNSWTAGCQESSSQGAWQNSISRDVAITVRLYLRFCHFPFSSGNAALSSHRHRDYYATGSPREAPITENFSSTNRNGLGLQRVNKIWPQLASKEIKSFLFISCCGDQQPRQTATAGFDILWILLSSEPPTSFQK